MEISNALVRTMRFWKNLHQVRLKSKDWKALGINKTKEPKQDSKNLLKTI